MDIEKEKQLFIIQYMNRLHRGDDDEYVQTFQRRYRLYYPALTKKSKHNFNIGILYRDDPKLYRKIYMRIYNERILRPKRIDLE